ncbi:hypothetical protein [Paraburkholderia fungorum]|uniref:hypothetical protein n=1 Tax=Paraburkholderia fungorum TaxID=134537 RepID=UPI001C1EC955|nr:hypothetical protein [Paraburkholderia fungorum]MBU7442272.1 hypothetical protein [Paraburkholderia fungorum]
MRHTFRGDRLEAASLAGHEFQWSRFTSRARQRGRVGNSQNCFGYYSLNGLSRQGPKKSAWHLEKMEEPDDGTFSAPNPYPSITGAAKPVE